MVLRKRLFAGSASNCLWAEGQFVYLVKWNMPTQRKAEIHLY